MSLFRLSIWAWLGLYLMGCQSSSSELVDHNTIQIPVIQLISSDSLIEKTREAEIYYLGKIFSGRIITLYDNGTTSLSKSYFEGKLHGETKAFYPDGKIMYSRPYFHGEKHGDHIAFYPSGQRKFHYIIEKGFNEGNHKSWYEDGSLNSDMNYNKGKEFGKQQVWRKDGKLRANYIVRENGRRYGLQGIKRCTKLDGKTQTIDPYKGT